MIRLLFRTVLVLALAAGVAAAVWYYAMPREQAAEVATVHRGTLRLMVTDSAETRIRHKQTLVMPVGGRLLPVQLRPGNPVSANKPVATVAAGISPLLDHRTVVQTEARVEAARASVEQAEDNKKKAKAGLDSAQAQLERLKRIKQRDSTLVSPEEMENAESLYKSRSAEYDAARKAIIVAREELKQAEAALLQDPSDGEPSGKSRRVEVMSPCNGCVLRVFQEGAAFLAPGAPILEVGSPNDLELVIAVLSSEASRVAPGNPVAFEGWGGDSLQGKVTSIEPSAFTKVSSLGIEEKRVNVLAELTLPGGRGARPGDGYRGEAKIQVNERSNVLLVPTSALFRRQKQWTVFALIDGRATARAVDVGHRSGSDAEVRSGLQEGDRVLLHPDDQVREGARIVER